MSAILSIFNRDGRPVEPKMLEKMLAVRPERAVDGQSQWINGPIALGHQHFWVTPEEWGEIQPLADATQKRVIAADVRIDNRKEILSWLDIAVEDGRRLSDTALILLAYERWGTACVEKLLGDFAFALWDSARMSLFLARDVLGTRGLCYSLDDHKCLVASEVGQLLAHPGVSSAINERKIADYLAIIKRDQEESLYESIKYCPPGHCLWISADEARQWRYWQFDPHKRIRYKDEQDYAGHFMALLKEAVRCRLRTQGTIGISMSGGLDSTIVAALATKLLPQVNPQQKQLKSFSYIFDELTSCDERSYIQPVAKRYQLETTFIACDNKWTLRHFEKWPVLMGIIFADAYAWLPRAVMEAAEKQGCRVLLSGYFGDMLFLGSRYWAVDMLRDLRLRELARTVYTQPEAVYWRRDFLQNGLRQLVPRSLDVLVTGKRPIDVSSRYPGIHPRLSGYVLDYYQSEARNTRLWEFGRPNWFQYKSLTGTSFPAGVAATRHQYNGHGLELLMPYWDRRLVEFVLAVPTDQLGRPGRDRWLLRNSARELLPVKVAERRRRTVFTPLMKKGVLEKEAARVAEIFKNPLIVERSFVDEAYLKSLLQDDKGWYNSEERYFLWKCLSLELWLRQILN